MKLIDVYDCYKKDYKKYVIIIESGIFYNVFNDDVGILYSLFNYKIKKSSNNYIIGFPSNNIAYIIDNLKFNNINYTVLNKDDNGIYYISDKNKVFNNRYNNYRIDFNRLSYINNRMKFINDKLSKRVFDKNIEKILFLKNEYNINIPIYKKGKGLPIGNMTSQIIACFYLDELDKYIVKELDIKYYIRYMVDGVLFHQDKEYLKYCLKQIEIIVGKYKLKLNKKTKIYSSKEEIEFLGFRYMQKNNKIIMKVNNKTKKNFKKKVNKDNISSYLGHLSYGNCNGLIYKVTGGKI